jgi:non-homologous end joining protein Ku
MPPLRTGLVSFGLVSIPVQLQPAIQNQNISFHWLHAAPEAPQRAQIIDLMQALKQSIEKAKPKQSRTSAAQAEDGFVRKYKPCAVVKPGDMRSP